jgi:hypothetical protein
MTYATHPHAKHKWNEKMKKGETKKMQCETPPLAFQLVHKRKIPQKYRPIC